MSAPQNGRGRSTGPLRLAFFLLLMASLAASFFAAGTAWAPVANIAVGVVVAVVGITLIRMRRSHEQR